MIILDVCFTILIGSFVLMATVIGLFGSVLMLKQMWDNRDTIFEDMFR